jgi:hypothetical protein
MALVFLLPFMLMTHHQVIDQVESATEDEKLGHR